MTGGGYDVSAAVPGSVVSALLENGLIPDPYYGTNEEAVQPVFDHDYAFSRTFSVTREDLARGGVFLCCDGLDTVCRVVLNGREIAVTDNMHCRYRFEIRSVLRAGENTLRLEFRSPVEYTNALTSPLGPGFASMRKAHCMFGWDWGIRLPDSGVWRSIRLELAAEGRLTEMEVRQAHGPDGVRLTLNTSAEIYRPGLQLRFTLRDPEGEPLFAETFPAGEENIRAATVRDPRLWWPAGYGEQPFYQVTADLLREGRVLDSRTLSIGLRTVSLCRDETDGHRDYQFIVNGTPIFVKGANIVIEDAVISRPTPQRWERMVRDAAESNYNTLRVWGGAYYPPDVFYDLCDRAGLLVYQDFMFACRFYWPGEDFLSSVEEEVRQQVLRLRSHPCLALWCGNNEADFFYTAYTTDEPETAAIREMFQKPKLSREYAEKVQWLYGKTFLELIPPIVRALSPEIPYVHSSPSVGDRLGAESLFDYFENGDAHYYHHVNGDAPYRKLEGFHLRFLSEFGFQSYPDLKTLREYLPAGSLSPYSREMLAHQKSPGGNETIERYLARDFFVPKDFGAYVYMSQMMAGEILRCTAEHMRRDRAYSRGLLLWQHNDCWPVVSWSGVDYRGRWKAQQYYAKRFFAPVLASARLADGRAELVLVNDRPEPVAGRLQWTLYDGRSILRAGSADVTLAPAGAETCAAIPLPAAGWERCVLCCTFRRGEQILSRNSLLLTEQREHAFERPVLRAKLTREGADCRLELTADCFVKSLCVDAAEGDIRLSDNFFDLEPNMPYTIAVYPASPGALDGLQGKLIFRSVNDVACGAEAEGTAVSWEGSDHETQ